MVRDPDTTLQYLLYSALKEADVDKPKPFVGNIVTNNLIGWVGLPILKNLLICFR